MKLLKEDIQFIDNYLENSGVTLVDVRLEMVDHIASEIETAIEKEEQDNFYDAFKAYMVKGKKALLKEYEKERATTFDKVLMRTLYTFLNKDVLLFGLLSFILVSSFQELISSFFEYNLVLMIPAFVLYFVLFKGAKKTSIATALFVAMILPVYLWLYFKTPFQLIAIILIYLIYRIIYFKYIEGLSFSKKVLFCFFVPFVVFMPIYFFIHSYADKLMTPIIELSYCVFQLMHWYVVFKQIFRYKKELDSKYKLLLG